MNKNENWREILRWILTILSAILAGLGADAASNNPVVAQLLNL